MWFGTLNLFYIDGPVPDEEALNEALSGSPFRACTPRQEEAVGFVHPWHDDTDRFVYGIMGCYFMCLKFEKREVPGPVLKEEVEKRVRAMLKDDPTRKINKASRKNIKEQAKYEMLPKAFSKFDRVHAYIDRSARVLVINAGNATKAQSVVKVLSGCFPDSSFKPVQTTKDPVGVMTGWLSDQCAPEPWEFGFKATLGKLEDKSAIQYQSYEVDHDRYIREYINEERRVTSLQFRWDGKVEFVLKDDALFASVKFIGDSLTDSEDHEAEEAAHNRDSILTVMTATVRELYDDFLKQFGGLKKFADDEEEVSSEEEFAA